MLHPRTAVLVSAFLASAACAQGLETLKKLRETTDAIMVKVGSGDIEGGLKAVKPLSIVPEAEIEAAIGQAKLQLPVMTTRFGQVIGHEFIREDRVGESLARIVYIQRFEKHAMRWMFYCYKSSNGWVINTFRFDDRWPDLF
jgi:hypothetical protein